MFHLSVYFGKNIFVYYCEDKYIHMIIHVHDASYQIVLYHWSQISNCCFSSLKSSNPNKCNWACQVGQHKHYQYHWPPSPTAGEQSWKNFLVEPFFNEWWDEVSRDNLTFWRSVHATSHHVQSIEVNLILESFNWLTFFNRSTALVELATKYIIVNFNLTKTITLTIQFDSGGRTCKQFGNAVYPVGNVKRMVLRRKKPAAISVSSLEVLAGWVKTNW